MEKQEGFCWLLFTSDAGEMIGSIAARTEDGGFNLGFLLARSHWGRGYMQFSIGLLPSRGSHEFGQPVTWKTIPRPGRWKRLDSAARAFYPSFQCIPTPRQHLVIATPMRSSAVPKREGAISY